MATPESISIRQETVMARLQSAAGILSKELGIPLPDVPTWYRESAELPVMQLESVTDWIESVVKALHPLEPAEDAEIPADPDATTDTTEAPAVSPYVGLTKAQLQALADERKLAVTGTGAQGNVLVDDLRAALDADDAAQAEGA